VPPSRAPPAPGVFGPLLRVPLVPVLPPFAFDDEPLPALLPLRLPLPEPEPVVPVVALPVLLPPPVTLPLLPVPPLPPVVS